MEINCDQVVEKYLLNQNPLYSFSFPISILVAIIIFGCAKAYNWSDNSYINQILIPILTFLLTMVFIDIISRWMISHDEKTRLVQLCKSWMHDPSNKTKQFNMGLISKYNVENFTNDDVSNMRVDNILDRPMEINKGTSVETPIAEISQLSPYPLEFRQNNSKCVEGSNCCSICSDTENPCNLIAPIPGPQWLPQSAESVQNRLKNNDYTKSRCPI